MSIFIGSNAGDTIEPGFVSPSVTVIGNPKTPGAGVDIILAGSGDDRVAGGGGNDIVSLGAGNDLYTWNSGDGNDLVDGGSGTDTLAFNGSAGAETIKLASGILGTTRVSSSADNGGVTFEGVEHIVVSAGDGDDVVDASGLPAGRASLEIIGGRGNDRLIGSTGNDSFVWNPGDGSDTVEGNSGTDTLQFNGSNAAEDMVLLGNGSHALLTRNVGAITMDLHGMETVNIAALGGTDNITIGDMTGTGIKQVNVDLGTIGGADDGATDIVTVAGSATDDSLNFTVPITGSALVEGLGGEQVAVEHMGVGDRVVVDGGAGNDTVTANGTGADDVIGIARDGVASIAVFSGSGPVIDVTNVEHLLVQGGGGNDTLAAQNGIGALTQLTLDGGAGNDTLRGGDGNDLLLGGDGNDFVDGNIGSDTASLGAGDDVFSWDPGDGSDVVEGGSGTDTLQFNGSNAAENMVLSASGSHAILTRNVGAVTMDLHGMENVNIRALGSADNITIGDLTGTGISQVHVDLGAFDGTDDDATDVVTVAFTPGDDAIAFKVQAGPAVIDSLGGAQVFVDNQGVGDRFAIDGGAGNDSVTANGTGGDDVIGIARDGTNSIAVFAEGGQAISLTNVEHLLVEGGAGNDIIVGQNGIALTQLTIDGGIGNDSITGGDGNDTLLGGDGNDLVNGARGNDTAQLGAGDDTFVWNPGDGSDTVEGQGGFDTMLFNGSNIGENMEVSANGSRMLFTRNVGSITMDLNDVERVDVTTLGGADNVVVNDLSGTDVTAVNVNLAAAAGGGDGSQDLVSVNATSGNDVAVITGDASGISVQGLAARVSITGAEGALDQLHVNGGAGDDVIDASGVAAGTIGLVLDGGEGDDVILGSAGDDVLIGGPGDDILIGNGGNDTFVAAPGNDVVIQGFAAGAGSEDTIDLRGISGAQDFAWIMAHASDVEGNAVLDLGGGAQVTIDDVSVASLHSDDFLLGG